MAHHDYKQLGMKSFHSTQFNWCMIPAICYFKQSTRHRYYRFLPVPFLNLSFTTKLAHVCAWLMRWCRDSQIALFLFVFVYLLKLFLKELLMPFVARTR